MRRVRYYRYGGPELLVLEDVEPPLPGAGQVVVRVEAVGVNFVDTKFRLGLSGVFRRPLPGRPTGDVVGVVVAVGVGVEAGLVGRRVAALVEDAYAEQVVAEAQWLAFVPDGLDLGDATMLPMGAPLALRLLRAARVADGETVLVHAAAGGIGHLAVQMARVVGAGTVVGITGSAGKVAFVRDLGADHVVDTSDPAWTRRVPGPVDVVLDSVGLLRDSLELLAPLGRAVVYGAAGGDLESVSVGALFGLRSLTGFNITAWRRVDPASARRDIEESTELFAAKRVRTSVHVALALEEAASAHGMIERREHAGRILLVP